MKTRTRSLIERDLSAALSRKQEAEQRVERSQQEVDALTKELAAFSLEPERKGTASSQPKAQQQPTPQFEEDYNPNKEDFAVGSRVKRKKPNNKKESTAIGTVTRVNKNIFGTWRISTSFPDRKRITTYDAENLILLRSNQQ